MWSSLVGECALHLLDHRVSCSSRLAAAPCPTCTTPSSSAAFFLFLLFCIIFLLNVVLEQRPFASPTAAAFTVLLDSGHRHAVVIGPVDLALRSRLVRCRMVFVSFSVTASSELPPNLGKREKEKEARTLILIHCILGPLLARSDTLKP